MQKRQEPFVLGFKNRRGISSIIATLLLILLTIVLAGILWAVISNIVKSSSSQATSQFGTIFLDLKLQNVIVNSDGTISAIVQRQIGQGDLTGVAFVVSDGTNSVLIKKPASIVELGSQTFTLTPSDLGNVSFAGNISIAPLIGETGNQQIGRRSDSKSLTTKEILQSLGAVSWWKMDGDATDEFGLNNGVIYGAVNCTVVGYYGNACEFHNSTSEKISINPLPASLQITGEMTVDAWVYPRSPPTGLGRIVATTYKYDPTPNLQTGWTLGNNFGSTDSFYFWVYGNSGSVNAAQNNFFSTNMNKWTHVVGVFKPSQYVRLYVNGNLKAEVNSSVPASINYNLSMPFKIGGRADTDSQAMWNGSIDEVTIFNRALTSQQVQSLYTLDLSSA